MAQKNARSFLFSTGLPLGQGAFYILTGLWPILSPASFQRVTGPKADLWLVKTVGALLALTGAIVARAGLRAWPGARPDTSPQPVPIEVAALAGGTAAVLAGSDFIYGGRGRIARIYVLEGLVELSLLALWVASLRRLKLARRAGG